MVSRIMYFWNENYVIFHFEDHAGNGNCYEDLFLKRITVLCDP